MIRICGLDLSLAKTGVAHLESQVDNEWTLTTSRITTRPHDPLNVRALRDRMDYIRFECSIEAKGSQLVVIEGPSLSSKGSSSKDLAGLWHLVYDRLCVDYRTLVVPPSSLKKWATGKGNVGKPQVAVGLHRTLPQSVFGVDFAAVDDNEADAAGLCAVGAQAMGWPIPIDLPKYRTDVVAGLRLPEEEAA